MNQADDTSGQDFGAAEPKGIPSLEITLRVELHNTPGSFARLAQVIAQEGANLGTVDIVATGVDNIVRDVSLYVIDQQHRDQLVERVRRSAGVNLVNVTDHALELHAGGKLQVTSRIELNSRRAIAEAYLPGVLAVSRLIAEQPLEVHNYSIKKNSIAVVTDGSDVAELGNVGPDAALPVIEGKAMIFRQFADVDAYPLALDCPDPSRLAEIIAAVSPAYGAIDLEEMDGERSYAVHDALSKLIDIPIYHDLYDGWAIVVLALLRNAAKVIETPEESLRVRIFGKSAGLRAMGEVLGMAKIAVVDSDDARVLIGLEPDVAMGAEISRLAGPESIVILLGRGADQWEIDEFLGRSRVLATTRSDMPNQIDPILAGPGLVRGALGVLATAINTPMKVAAARALADTIHAGELSEDHLLPSVFNREVVKNVSKAVAAAALKSGVGRKRRHRLTH